MKSIIVSLAKNEQEYIYEFVKYHLKLGFDIIRIYDNEDKPTYFELLKDFKKNIEIIHLPTKNFINGPQYEVLEKITREIKQNKFPYDYCIHIDIDEMICLKNHKNIKEFINEKFKLDIAGIGINWRFFGSKISEERSDYSVINRFTMCEKNGNIHIKTLFNTKKIINFRDCHSINPKKGFKIISPSGKILDKTSFNHKREINEIQINHYKVKTWEEYQRIRKRGRADLPTDSDWKENIEHTFQIHNKNEIEDLTAKMFFNN